MSPLFAGLDKAQTFALELKIDGLRVQTHKLTRHQAACARVAARHLADYLTEAYELDKVVETDDFLTCTRCGRVDCICNQG